jgi:PII-like signaling protein
MAIPQSSFLLRILIGESDRWAGRPTYEAIVLKARELGIAGATVLRGSMGFGATSIVHTAKVLRLSGDLPIVIEIVDSRDKIDVLLTHLDEMLEGGLVTIAEVEVIHYRGKTP